MERSTQMGGNRILPVHNEVILAHGKSQLGSYEASPEPVILKLRHI